MTRIIVSTTPIYADVATSAVRTGPKSVVIKVLFQGSSLVYFLNSESSFMILNRIIAIYHDFHL